jgi:hypothetical protein
MAKVHKNIYSPNKMPENFQNIIRNILQDIGTTEKDVWE